MSNIINSFSGKYHFLSNFHKSTIIYNNEQYQTVEHAYQAGKTLDEYERNAIKLSPTPGIAKKLGKVATIRADWADIKLFFMAELLSIKFHNIELQYKLLETNDSILIEGNTHGDTYWGICRGVGENNLGKLLMALRTEILKEKNEFITA